MGQARALFPEELFCILVPFVNFDQPLRCGLLFPPTIIVRALLLRIRFETAPPFSLVPFPVPSARDQIIARIPPGPFCLVPFSGDLVINLLENEVRRARWRFARRLLSVRPLSMVRISLFKTLFFLLSYYNFLLCCLTDPPFLFVLLNIRDRITAIALLDARPYVSPFPPPYVFPCLAVGLSSWRMALLS